MTFFLSDRNTTDTERMDDPNCDPEKLKNTYRQFSTINGFISQWRKIYLQEIRPLLNSETVNTLLDVGYGGGDITCKLAHWASHDGYDLQITAIDPDPRAFRFVQNFDRHSNISFLQCELSELDHRQQFDFVISNHLLHHLRVDETIDLLERAKILSSKRILFNDIQRSDWAYLLFSLLPHIAFPNSFIIEDGLTSIKRSYTETELTRIAPEDWQVKTIFPFRLLLKYDQH